jgi:hypothetical protein
MTGENDRERGSVYAHRTTERLPADVFNGLLWCNDILTRWTLCPNAFCPIVSFVFN